MDKIEKLNRLIDNDKAKLETKFQTLAILHRNKIDMYKMIILGVLFGLLGGLTATIFYDLLIKPMEWWGKVIILVILAGLLIYFIRDYIKRMKVSDIQIQKTMKDRNQVMNALDSMKL